MSEYPFKIGLFALTGRRGRPHQPFLLSESLDEWSFTCYKNVSTTSFSFVTIHAFDKRTDIWLSSNTRLHLPLDWTWLFIFSVSATAFFPFLSPDHRRSQVTHWVHVHSPERRKIVGPNLQVKVVSAPQGRECAPEAEQESFLIAEIWTVWEGDD